MVLRPKYSLGRTLSVIAIFFALLALGAGIASAHYQWYGNDAYTYGPLLQPLCVWNSSQIGTGPYGGGALSGYVGALKKANANLCGWGTETKWGQPAGWITLDVIAYRWNGSSWAKCFESGWYKNSSGGDHVQYSTNAPTSNAPCGAGTYTVVSNGWVWDGATWRGGGLQSPNIYLPSSDPGPGKSPAHPGRNAPELPPPPSP